MRKIFCAVMILALLCGCAYAENDSSSVMHFSDSILRDEAGIKWEAFGDPVLSSKESVTGGKSLYLDGDSYLQTENREAFDFPREFTMEAWVYPIEYVTDRYPTTTFTVFSRWLHGTRTLYSVNLVKEAGGDNSSLSFYSDFSGSVSVETESEIPIKQWTHIAVTRDSEKVVRLFINGKMKAEKRITQNFTSTDYPMTIGASSNAMRKSIGYIDEWHVYKRCLYAGDFEPSRGETSSAGRPENSQGVESSRSFANPAGESFGCCCGYSAADEIRKFKKLLDDGIITREEFDAVKKKLLGL